MEGFLMAGVDGEGREADPTEPESFPYRVLRDVPDTRTIPIFALWVEAGLKPVDRRVVASREALSKLVGGNLSRALERRYGPHRLVTVRRRVGKRTAVYTAWLAFPEMAVAESFIRDQPRFGLDTIDARTKSQLETRTRQLKNGVANGRYDLSRLDENARLKRARFFVEESAALDRLEWQLYGLSMLRKSLDESPEGVSVG
jgi:hypothetical protein